MGWCLCDTIIWQINKLWVSLELDKVTHFMWILRQNLKWWFAFYLIDWLKHICKIIQLMNTIYFGVWWMSSIVESSLHCIVLPYFNLFLWGTLYESAFQEDNLDLEQCKTSSHQIIGGKEIGNKYPALLLPYGADGLSEGPPNAMQMLNT
jgi:hypothetical protein